MFKLYPEGYPVEWWMMHLFSWESPHFGTEFFVIHPLTSVVTISWEKRNALLTLGGVLRSFVDHSTSAPLLEPERHGFTPKGGY
jgi:hypothetical protein